MKNTLLFTFLSIVGSTILYGADKREIIKSPNELLTLELIETSGEIAYKLSKEGTTLINESKIAIFPDKKHNIISSKKSKEKKKWTPTWGQFSEIKSRSNNLELSLEVEGRPTTLYVKLFDNGVGFRYALEGYNSSEGADFYCEYQLEDNNTVYYPMGEFEPAGPYIIKDIDINRSKKNQFSIPLVVEQSNNTFLSLLESDLLTSNWFTVMNIDFSPTKRVFYSSNRATVSSDITEGDRLITPWRVILVENSNGDLVTNCVALNLATECKLENNSWVKPGKTIWDWRVHGYVASDGFKYGIDTESYKRYIDFAAENDIEYFLIDDGWYSKVTSTEIEAIEGLDIVKVSNYAEEKGVDLLLYYDRRKGNFGDETLLNQYDSLGAHGLKYGFMAENVPFTRNAIEQSAKREMIINFHDAPAPLAGAERTYPNAITREYCHAQQDRRTAFTPESFIKMALVNAIIGPLDMNNGNFDLTGINSSKRDKSVVKPNSYHSTVVSEAARTLIINTGLLCLPDAPEAYREKSDLFEFISSLPIGKWDESIVINSKFGEFITTARRSKNRWFVGSVIDSQGGEITIPTDFLKKGRLYKVTLYEDGANTHCVTNPEEYTIKSTTLKGGEVIKAKLAPGGGHCILIEEAI